MEDFKGTRVLVVDDDRLICEMMRDALLEDEFEVDTARSGSEALERLRDNPPFEVVLTDLSMRDMDGLQLMEAVKRLHPRTDVIIMTGYGSLESALRAMRLGAADYLRKPVRAQEVLYSVKQTLLRRNLVQENESLRSYIEAFEVARSLSSCLEPDEVLPMLLTSLLRLLGGGKAIGHLLSGVASNAESICLSGFSEKEQQRLSSLMESEEIFDVSALSLREDGGHPRVHCQGLGRMMERAGIGGHPRVLALRLEGAIVGGVWLVREDGEVGEVEERQIDLVVSQAELALINADRFVKAREHAFVDDVTELYNVRYLRSSLEREVMRAQRGSLELSVLFLDLDRFKVVNDTHGHLVGSAVLAEFGSLLQRGLRSIDTLARYGGDEFTIVLVDTGAEEALAVAQRIRAAVEAHGFQRDLELRLSVSIGCASYPRDGLTCEALLAASDQAMYRAKAEGRNRVCVAREE